MSTRPAPLIAAFLEQRKFPVMRRVVRKPERWPRIVEIAASLGERLPGEPDPKALQEFLLRRRTADPLRFPDLSLMVIKLLGRGEYVASNPGENASGHFGLAVSDYTHSTAPNRRYPDLITQRLVRAALAGQPIPYAHPELEALALHCTLKEDDAQKIERLMRKAAAASMMSDRIGSEFDGIVPGASTKGTWARVLDPPFEGRIVRDQQGLDVGDRVRVRLLRVDAEHGFIDFAREHGIGGLRDHASVQ
jgi:exoribonuclease-2